MNDNFQQRRNKKLLLTIIGVAILVIGVVGATYAFFNYTRTGGQNIVKTGRITFSATEGTAINLTNAFPITSTQAQTDTTNAKTLSITVAGDTDYVGGLEYLVTAADVHMTTTGNKSVPLSIEVSAQNLGSEETGNYYANKASYTVSKYKVLYDTSSTLSEGERILVGYIAPNTELGTASGINGVITIKAYFDANRIAITDTYNESNPGTDDYGTTTSWVAGREVFTTTEWNALTSSGLSFKIKVESNEGKWVEAPVTAPTIASCPNCKFIFSTTEFNYGGTNNADATLVSTLSGVTDDYTTLNKDYFIGFTEDQGKVDRAFACGIKLGEQNQETAFCIEGTLNGSTLVYESNQLTMTQLFGSFDESSYMGCEISDGDYGNTSCYGSASTGDMTAYSVKNGYASINVEDPYCYVSEGGSVVCME